MLFHNLNKECSTHKRSAMLALLGLLLAGAEPSSRGFLTGKVNQALDGDNTRAFATNVVHHRANDSNNTMHNYEVQLTCMDHHATHNQLSVLKLTSPLHALRSVRKSTLVIPTGLTRTTTSPKLSARATTTTRTSWRCCALTRTTPRC